MRNLKPTAGYRPSHMRHYAPNPEMGRSEEEKREVKCQQARARRGTIPPRKRCLDCGHLLDSGYARRNDRCVACLLHRGQTPVPPRALTSRRKPATLKMME